ncbi:MAG: S1 RNA-binding domain-containing protein, partial [Pseudomonadota bacterium]
IGTRLNGQITNITDYGAFVELEDGVEGLIHVSEMSWTKKNVHPGKIVSTSQEVDVEVLDVDSEKRRISLGLKQTMDNPWDAFLAENPIGSEIEGDVRGITEFGMFVGLGPDLDGMVHINDISWDQSGEEAIVAYNKGDTVRAKVLDVDAEKERISLGIKQLGSDPLGADAGVARNAVVTCTVTEVASGGIEVEFGDPAMRSFIRRSDLSRDRSEQRPERFAVGDKVDARVTNVDRGSRRVTLSIKALEIAEEKEAVAQYGSADSGASLGDILGAALAGSDSSETEPEAVATEATPAAEAPAEAEESADDLKKLTGVGPVLAGKLADAGVSSFAQIAGLSSEEIADIEEKVGAAGKFEKEGWVEQAKELAGS